MNDNQLTQQFSKLENINVLEKLRKKKIDLK
jgi:hypothetical protein